MGTYSLCVSNNCTDAERAFNLTERLDAYAPRGKVNTTGWAGGLQGRAANLIALPGSRATPGQLSPGLWFSDECAPTGEPANADGEAETSTHGWTASSLRDFLDNAHGQGIRSVDIWCGVGVLLPMPCPTCSWVFDELRRWQLLKPHNRNNLQ